VETWGNSELVMAALGAFEAAFFLWLVLRVPRRDGLVHDAKRLAHRWRDHR
jgi:hypothetical protein